MREIRFRAWDKTGKIMFKWGDIQSNPDGLTNPRKYDLELMQFTGLKDKHGKEIYEADLITDGIRTGEVEFNTEIGAFSWLGGEEWGMIEYESVEVIGNVRENPELLDSKKRGK